MLMLSMHRKRLALSQLQDMQFNSMVMFNGQPLGAGLNGVYSLDECSAAGIDAYIETPLTDFGITNQKRLRRVYLSGEFSSSPMEITVKNDEGNSRTFTTTTPAATEKTIYANIDRDGKGSHWSMQVSNEDGKDFSIDSISIIPVILNRRR